MMKSFYSKQNSFLPQWQQKKLISILIKGGLFFMIVLIFVYIGGNKMRDIFQRDNYYPQTKERIGANLDLEILFNDQVKSDVFSQRIVQVIDGAKQSIKIAMFALTSPAIISALDRAEGRGVVIELVFDESNRERYYASLINVFLEGQAVSGGVDDEVYNVGYYMHNKFVLIDNGLADARLIAGTLNWTDWQEQYDPSYLIITSRPEILEVYNAEWERLWSGISGTNKLRQSNYQPWAAEFVYNNATLELWWGPGFKENSFHQRLLDLIAQAENNISVAIWQLTDYDLARALLAKAIQGVKISIITDDFNFWSSNSEFSYLLKQKELLGLDNMEIITDSWRSVDLDKIYQVEGEDFFNSYFHRHELLVDNKILALGTANWSYRGFWGNDESNLVTDDLNVIQAWQESWNYHYQNLQAQELYFEKNDQVLTLVNGFDKLIGKNLLAICEVSNEAVKPLILGQATLNDLNRDVEMIGSCPHLIQVFVYDDDNKLVGAGRVN